MKNLFLLILFASTFQLSALSSANSADDASKQAKLTRIHEIMLKVYLAQGDKLKANSEYVTLLKLNTKDAKMFYDYANFLFNQNKVKDSATFYAKACQLAPENAPYAARLGSILFYLQNYDGAVKAYSDACRIGGQKYQPSLTQAVQYQAQVRAVQAQKKALENR